MKITRINRSQAKHDPTRSNYFDGEVNIQAIGFNWYNTISIYRI